MKKRSLDDWLDYISVFILAISTVASAWCVSQASLWSSHQTFELSEYGGLERQVANKEIRAGQLRLVDSQLFTQYLNASIAGNKELADFYLKKFRPEAKIAVAAWLKTNPIENESSPAHPFLMDEYKLELEEEAMRLQSKAAVVYNQARDSNRVSDLYTLLTLLFATVLFLEGITLKLPSRWMRYVVLSLGAFLWLCGVIIVLQLPVTWTTWSGQQKGVASIIHPVNPENN